MTSTLHFRRNHPGGGPKGRCSYAVEGLPGLVVFDMGLFLGKAPATITLDCQFAEPKPKVEPKAKATTGAVVEVAPVAKAKGKVKGTKAA